MKANFHLLTFVNNNGSILILLFLCFCLFSSLGFCPAPYVDEYWIASISNSSFLSSTINNPSLKNFASGYINIQPLYIGLGGAVVKLLGSSLFSIRLLSAICIIASAYISLKIVSNICSVKTGYKFFWMVGFVITVPIIWRTAHINRPEPLIILFVLLAMWFNTLNTRSRIINLGIGIVTTIPVYFYITGIIVFPMVLLIWIFQYLFDVNRKLFIPVLGVRVVGILLGLVVFFLLVGSPMEVFQYLSGSNISAVNVTDKTFISRFLSYGFYYINYLLENILWYGPSFIVILYLLYKRKFKFERSIYLFGLTYLISVLFLAVLSRKSVNYLVYSEIFFVMLLLSVLFQLFEDGIYKIVFVSLFTLNILFVLLYSVYFIGFDFESSKQKVLGVVSDNSVLLGRIQYKGFFFGNDDFLAFEDYGNLVKTGRGIDQCEYLVQNQVNWIIWDDEAEREFPEFRNAINGHFRLVAQYEDDYVGHRIYEDIPYSWDFPAIIKRIQERPKSSIRIFRRLKE